MMFRFTIRDVLWLTLVAALRNRAVVNRFKAVGGCGSRSEPRLA